MEQRTLRLGDIVDDYCPRERRLTNHAIVAIVEDSIRQTRCTTCDSEHVYKGGQEPKRRLVKPAAAAGKPADQAAPAAPALPPSADPGEDAPPVAAATAGGPEPSSSDDASAESDGQQPGNGRADDLWIGNRPLIRATLPKVEGDQPPVPRPIPEFTMHQRQTRGAHAFRHGYGGQNPNWSGNGHPRGGFRDGRGGGQGNGGNGNTQGQRPGRRGRRRGGKKNR
jgi:hypothetical protein